MSDALPADVWDAETVTALIELLQNLEELQTIAIGVMSFVGALVLVLIFTGGAKR